MTNIDKQLRKMVFEELDKKMDRLLEDGVTHGTMSWTLMDDVYHVTCPDCGRTILMSKKRTLDKLKRWARRFIK